MCQCMLPQALLHWSSQRSSCTKHKQFGRIREAASCTQETFPGWPKDSYQEAELRGHPLDPLHHTSTGNGPGSCISNVCSFVLYRSHDHHMTQATPTDHITITSLTASQHTTHMTAGFEEVCQLRHGNEVGDVWPPGGGSPPVETQVTLGQDGLETLLANDLLRGSNRKNDGE